MRTLAVLLLLLGAGCSRPWVAHGQGRYAHEWRPEDGVRWDGGADSLSAVRSGDAVVAEGSDASDLNDEAAEWHASIVTAPYQWLHPTLGLVREVAPGHFAGERADGRWRELVSWWIPDRAAFEAAAGPLIPFDAALARLLDGTLEEASTATLLLALDRSAVPIPDPAPLRRFADDVDAGLPATLGSIYGPDPAEAVRAVHRLAAQAFLVKASRRWLPAELVARVTGAVHGGRSALRGPENDGLAQLLDSDLELAVDDLASLTREREAHEAWLALEPAARERSIDATFAGWQCGTPMPRGDGPYGELPVHLMDRARARCAAAEASARSATEASRREAEARAAAEAAAAAARAEEARRDEALRPFDDALLAAVVRGDLPAARAALAAGARTTATGGARRAALELAVMATPTNLPMIELLLARGADPNEFRDEGYGDQMPPLARAAERGDLALVERLLAAGALVDRGGQGGSALCFAVREDRVEVARLLLDRGAAATENCGAAGWKTRLLFTAAWRGNDAMVALLLERGADAKEIQNGSSTLAMARRGGARGEAAARRLAAAGALFIEPPPVAETPLVEPPTDAPPPKAAPTERERLLALTDEELFARLPVDDEEAGILAEIARVNRAISNLGGLMGTRYAAEGVTGEDCEPGRSSCGWFRQGGGESGSSYVANANLSRDIRDLELERSGYEGRAYLHRINRVRALRGK